MLFFRRLTTVLAIVLATQVWAQKHGNSEEDITVMNPWTRAVPIAGMNAAGYMMLMNNTDKTVTLRSFITDTASKASLHETVKNGDMVSMKALPRGIGIPAKSKIELKPGGLHLMLIKIKQPFNEGDEIPVTLVFDSGKELATTLVVKPVGSMGDHGKMHH